MSSGHELSRVRYPTLWYGQIAGPLEMSCGSIGRTRLERHGIDSHPWKPDTTDPRARRKGHDTKPSFGQGRHLV
jgi:hypothetical protein